MKTQLTLFFRHPSPSFNSIEELFGNVVPELPDDIEVRKVMAPKVSRGLFRRITNIIHAKKNQGGINHITGDIHYIASGLPGKNTILTIHDLVPLQTDNWLKRKIIKLFWYTMPVKRVKYVTVISEKTKNELVGEIKVSADKIKVIPNCVSPRITYVPKGFNKEKPVILQIGTKSNKNLERVVKALINKPQRVQRCELWVLGKLSENQKELLDQSGIACKNYFNLPFEEVIDLYNKCDMLVFASTYEGFGVPILEAQATGRAVITSYLSPMREVAGEGALFVDPFDIEDIRNGILKVIEDDEYREKLIQKGLENVKRYSAEKITSMYLDLYKEVEKNNN